MPPRSQGRNLELFRKASKPPLRSPKGFRGFQLKRTLNENAKRTVNENAKRTLNENAKRTVNENAKRTVNENAKPQ